MDRGWVPWSREGACRGETEGIEYQLRRSPADQFVVAVKLLLAGVGVEPRGWLIRTVESINQGLLWEEERKHAKAWRRQTVRHPQTRSLGGVQEGGGEQGCPGSGRADVGRVRDRSEEQSVQDLEPDELRVVLSASGAGGRDTEAAQFRNQNFRCTY